MASIYDNVPWTLIVDAPDGKLPECVPCGFKRETYAIDGVMTHYRFVPACGFEPTRLPDTEDFP